MVQQKERCIFYWPDTVLGLLFWDKEKLVEIFDDAARLLKMKRKTSNLLCLCVFVCTVWATLENVRRKKTQDMMQANGEKEWSAGSVYFVCASTLNKVTHSVSYWCLCVCANVYPYSAPNSPSRPDPISKNRHHHCFIVWKPVRSSCWSTGCTLESAGRPARKHCSDQRLRCRLEREVVSDYQKCK